MVQSLILHDEEFNALVHTATELCKTASARAVLLVDKDGQLLATAGDDQALDALSIASLTAGNVAATDGLAKLLGENEFGELYHQGEKDNIHISAAGERVLMVVIFNHRSSLGLVRLRVQQVVDTVVATVRRALERTTVSSDALSDLTVSEIDALLGEE